MLIKNQADSSILLSPVLFFARKTLFRSLSATIMDAESPNYPTTVVAVEEEVTKSQKRPIDSMLSSDNSANNEEIVKKPRIKKKKVAMLLSYSGNGYFGMQINHGFKTIEGDLFTAFMKVVALCPIFSFFS